LRLSALTSFASENAVRNELSTHVNECALIFLFRKYLLRAKPDVQIIPSEEQRHNEMANHHPDRPCPYLS
jgi:hypothetical protein